MSSTIIRIAFPIVAGLSLLTGCPDIPRTSEINGMVAGQSMPWIESELVVDTQVVWTDIEMSGTPSGSDLAQILLTDYAASCAQSDSAASPPPGYHTLALSLLSTGAIEPGTYSITSDEESVGTLSASFVVGLPDGTWEDPAIDGTLTIDKDSQGRFHGEFSLDFSDGFLEGHFQSTPCSAS